ncbi:MAG: class I lanthipeptide [Bacteroidetes bacterium]|nr:class I lanthipeptide [Bacteroidota bacterium]
MKKIKINAARLQLNKEKITSLQVDEMNHIRGGEDYVSAPIDATIVDPPAFTYSLSMGARCKASDKLTANGPLDCGWKQGSSDPCKQMTIY